MDRDPARRPKAATLLQDDGLPRLQGDRRRPRLPVRRTALLTGVAMIAVAAVLVAWLVPDRSAPQAAAPDLIGLGPNPAAVDPCALIPYSSLRQFGTPMLGNDLNNFGTCVVTTTFKNGVDQVQTVLGLENPLRNPSRPPMAGKMGEIERPDETDGSCDRNVDLPDTHRLTVTTRRTNKAEKAPICLVSESLLGDVMAAVTRGSLPQRTEEFAEQSLGRVDACTLLSASQASLALGDSTPEPQREFGNWSCFWEGPHGDLWLQYTREWPIEYDEDYIAMKRKLITLAGRQVLVIPEPGNKATCRVMIVHRLYEPPKAATEDHKEREEVAVLRLIDKSSPSVETTCAKAQVAAEAVIRSLPKTT